MRIANVTTPSADYLVPAPELVREGNVVENLYVRCEIPLATDPVRLAIKDLVYLDAALRAEREGFDGIFVNTVADYGIDLMRAAVGIPVVGAGEAAIRAASTAASSFSIVTVWPSSTAMYYDRVLASTQSRSTLRSLRFVLDERELGPLGGGAGVMASVHESSSAVSERVLRVARDAVERDGAESIVLGCTCMTALAESMSQALAVVVVDPLSAGFLEIQAMDRVESSARVAGISEDTAARVSGMVDLWEEMGGSVTSAWADDCGDVCAVVAQA